MDLLYNFDYTKESRNKSGKQSCNLKLYKEGHYLVLEGRFESNYLFYNRKDNLSRSVVKSVSCLTYPFR